MIHMNLIRNNEVIIEDINVTTWAFGLDIEAVKGKSIRSEPIPVLNNMIEIPNKQVSIHEDVTLSIDGLAASLLNFLISISHSIIIEQFKTSSNL
eukprot:15365508-Ditylum_brightwellii.AAC.2